jgi:hypothetical protein
MSILLLVFIVIILLCLALYIVNLLPLPGAPAFAKPILMILCVAVAFIVIAERAGVLR